MTTDAEYQAAVHRACARMHSALPDNIAARKQILRDILALLGEEHPLHQVAAQQLSHLVLADEFQAELNLRFLNAPTTPPPTT